jgi:hypothetical protein
MRFLVDECVGPYVARWPARERLARTTVEGLYAVRSGGSGWLREQRHEVASFPSEA